MVPPAQPIAPLVQPVQAPEPQLNRSHFKPEFAGQPDEDAEAHPLRTITGWTLKPSLKVSKSSVSVYH